MQAHAREYKCREQSQLERRANRIANGLTEWIGLSRGCGATLNRGIIRGHAKYVKMDATMPKMRSTLHKGPWLVLLRQLWKKVAS
jgi:hypothetical protein